MVGDRCLHVSAEVSRAVDCVTQVHGYAAPVEWMAATLAWDSRYASLDSHDRILRAAKLLSEAAALLVTVGK